MFWIVSPQNTARPCATCVRPCMSVSVSVCVSACGGVHACVNRERERESKRERARSLLSSAKRCDPSWPGCQWGIQRERGLRIPLAETGEAGVNGGAEPPETASCMSHTNVDPFRPLLTSSITPNQNVFLRHSPSTWNHGICFWHRYATYWPY